MKYSKEIKIAVVVLGAIGLLYYGINFLKSSDIFSSNRNFVALYNRVDGLSRDNAVQLNGFTVGKVSAISLDPTKKGRIKVTVSISESSLEIPKNSVVRIIDQDLLGTKVITLELGDDPVMAQEGDTLNPALEEDIMSIVERQLKPIQMKVEGLISEIDSVVSGVKDILDKEGRENLSQSFESIKNSFETFEKTSERIDAMVESERKRLEQIFTNVESITKNLKNNNKQLTIVLNNMSDISDSIAKADIAATISQANLAITNVAEVMDKVNRGEGSLGLLVNDDKLYNELTMAAYELNILMLDLRTNPSKFIPLKGRRKPKPLIRDSVFYRDMMKTDSALIQYRILQKDS